MIPQFPEFKKFEIVNKKDVEIITAKFPPYSLFNSLNLLILSYEGWKISSLNGNLVIKIQYSQKEADISFLGTNKVDETIKMLIPYTGTIKELINIPEIVIRQIKSPKNYKYNEDRDGFDYIYSLKDLSEYKGSTYKTIRKYAHRFTRRYPGYHLQLLDLCDEKIKKKLLNTFLIWEKSRNKTRNETKLEYRRIKIVLNNVPNFTLYAPGLFLHNELIAYQITGAHNNEFAIGYYEKYDVSYIGITAFLRQEIAKYLISVGCKYINWETDLGLENLRKTKLLWHPLNFLKVYTVRLK